MITNVRLAGIADLESINQIFYLSKSSWGYDEAFMAQCMSDFSLTTERLQKGNVILLYVDSRLAGFYGFIQEENEAPELDYFFLHPGLMKRGIGKALWNTCCLTARQLKFREFKISSDPNAEGFYLKMGCRKIGEEGSPIMKNRKLPILTYEVV